MLGLFVRLQLIRLWLCMCQGSAALCSLPSECHSGIIENNGAIIAKVNY